MNLVTNRLRVEHFPQVPCAPFCVEVADEIEAQRICNILADQHLFLYENGYIPDYSNAIVVTMWDAEAGEWVDYWNEAEAMEWDELEAEYLSNPVAAK